jgi:DNA-binding transcriptional LysR family regulator
MTEWRDLRFPSIDALRAFEAAARLGSFERAAEELAVTASAVGKRIGTLEELLGAPLFSRGVRALTLTASGKEYLAQVRAALGLLASVPLHRRSAQRRRRLRLCSPPTFARQVLVPALAAHASLQPEVELEVVLSTPFLEAEGPQADLYVQHGVPAGEGAAARTRPLMTDVLLPLAAPALLERQGGAAAQPEQLLHWPLLRTPLEPWASWFSEVGLDGPEPTTGPRLVDLGLVLEAAVCGLGVVLARPSLARQALQAGWLKPAMCPQTPGGLRVELLALTNPSFL